MDEQKSHAYERTPDEIAWDEEFKDDTRAVASDIGDIVKFVVRLPGALLSSVVPDETARHTRAAVREGFLALRSLLGVIGDGIEDMLAEPGGATSSTATVQGPPGTWGTGRPASAAPAPETPHTQSKAKRIEINEESGDMPT